MTGFGKQLGSRKVWLALTLAAMLAGSNRADAEHLQAAIRPLKLAQPANLAEKPPVDFDPVPSTSRPQHHAT